MRKRAKSIMSLLLCLMLMTQLIFSALADGPPPGGPGGPPGGQTTTETDPLIINQIYGGDSSASAVFSHSFIELYNDSGDSIDLSGYTISYSTVDGEALDTQTLALSGSVSGHTSFLIRCASTGNASAAYSIDTCDLSWEQAISAGDFQLVVCDSDDNATDAVAVGSSELFTEAESTAVTAALDDSKAIRRVEFADTDDNSADFAVIDYSDSGNYADNAPRTTDDGTWTLIKDFVLNIGSAEGEISVTWFSTTADSAGSFLLYSGSTFDESGATAYPATTAASESDNTGFYANKVTVSGLSSATTYTYRYGSDGVWSDVGTYTTPDYSADTYSFIVVGDPQIGASNDAQSDAEGWYDTLDTALSDGTDYSFIFSMGDQVETNNDAEEYSLFLDSSSLQSLAFAPAVGNHDSGVVDYAEHYTLPNVTEYGVTAEGNGDYYFTYGDGNTLFMVLNTNNSSVSEHKAFMEETIEANPNAVWKVVVFHQSIYSVASHVSDVETLRTSLAPVLNEMDIDVVLQGHDHVYARTYIMGGSGDDTGMEAQITEEDAVSNDTSSGLAEIYDPDGVQYVTVNSASGSKYYSISSEAYRYTEVMDQSKTPNYSNVTVTDTSFTITTYKVSGGSTTVIDDFTIYNYANEEYVNGYTTAYSSDTLSIAADNTRSLLLNLDTTSYSPSVNAAYDAGELHSYLTAISDNAAEIEMDVADGDYYAKLELYDSTGTRCGGSFGWTEPGDTLTADLSADAYSNVAYYTVVVKSGSTGTAEITGDPADYITLIISECDEHVSYGSITDATYGTYTYVEVTDLTPSVYVPSGAQNDTSDDYTDVLSMVEAYGEDEEIVVAVNAGIFYNNEANTYCFDYKEPDGVVISNGTVLKSTETIDHTQCDILVIDEHGNMGYTAYYADADALAAGTETWYNMYGTEINGTTSSDASDSATYGKIVSAVTAFVPVLINSTVVSEYDNYVGHYTQSAVRQIIGVKADGAYMLLSGTWTLAQAGQAALAEGCVFAYNLDGGGSTETVIGVSNTVVGNETGVEDYSAFDLVEQSKGTRSLPTYIVFTASDEAPVSATADSISAECSDTTYSKDVELADLVENLTVTESLTNADGGTSERTVYSAMGVDESQTLTNVVIGGASTVEECTVQSTSTAPNGTLYHTKTGDEITTCLSSNSNTRQSESYYDYSTGYTLSTSDDLSVSGTKTIEVSYLPGGDQQALTTTFTISIESASYSGTGSVSGGSDSEDEDETEETETDSAVSAPERFDDVDEDDWFADAVTYCVNNDLFDGTSDSTFDPDAMMTREMFAMILYRLTGEPDTADADGFDDVTDSSDYYYYAVIWGSENNIINGYEDGRFGVGDLITREQMVVLLYRYYQAFVADEEWTSDGSDITDYGDYEAIDDYAEEAFQWAYDNGLITGTSDTTLAPTDGATRAQNATILMRFCELYSLIGQ